jgi:hypothetical protein
MATQADSFLRMDYSKLWLHVILSRLTDGRSQLKLHHSVPTEDASGFRAARWRLVLLAAQREIPDSRDAPKASRGLDKTDGSSTIELVLGQSYRCWNLSPFANIVLKPTRRSSR